MGNENVTLITMVAIRMLSSLIELSAALVMLRMGTVRSALAINALLGLVGPTILISATLVGISGLTASVPVYKIVLIVFGVGLVVLGTR